MPEASKTEPVVVLGVTASIAAYKAADVASRLRKEGCRVHVTMTPEATKLVGPLTFQTLSRNPVLVDLFEEQPGWQPGHIELADMADLILVAPATANAVAELALGLARTVLGAISLATRAPMLIAPAMNGKMWEHAATQGHVQTLRERGAHFVGPSSGELACGYEGTGRLADPEAIVDAALAMLDGQQPTARDA